MPSDEPPAAGARTALRFEPLTLLATGGMAEIWLAREIGAAGFERFVVVKRLLSHLARDRRVVDMFVSEARFVARLVHPNVVQIHELGKDEQGYFLVMEYVAGCSVRELTGAARKAGEKLAPDIAVCILEQACRGLHAAHELADPTGRPLGLVHRDVSPHNLMIGPDGDVKLLDFGVAKATEAAEATHTGSLTGKFGYMSPEQCRAMPLDRRSDIFGLGIVLWELLVGERLFERGSEYTSLEAIVSGDIRSPSEVRPDLTPALDAVVMKALAKDVEARWQTADELRRALVAAAEGSGLRISRDALGAKVMEMLGERLDQRSRALREVANTASGADHTALRDALLGSASVHPPGATRSDSNDVATVVQHRGPRARSEPPAASDPASDPSSPPLDEGTIANPTRTIVDAGSASIREPSRAARPTRWLVVAVLALAAGALSAALFFGRRREGVTAAPSSQGDPRLAGPPLRFVLAPSLDPEVMKRELAPFVRWLSGKLDRPVEVSVADSYEQTGALVASGSAELGLLPPLLFVQTAAREPGLRPVVLRLFDGSRGSDGYLLVRDDAPPSGAEYLRGRAICLVDRESTTGFLLPRIWMREAGLDPDADVRTIFSGDHMAALRDLSTRRCDAAAVYSGAYLAAGQQGIRVGTTRVLAVTGRAPQDVVVAAPTVPDAEVARVRELLLGFEPQRDIGAPRIGTMLGISGFAPFDATDFDRIREAARREGMLPGADAGR